MLKILIEIVIYADSFEVFSANSTTQNTDNSLSPDTLVNPLTLDHDSPHTSNLSTLDLPVFFSSSFRGFMWPNERNQDLGSGQYG